MGMNGVGGRIAYTPTKQIKPLSYNGIRSTGFKGVQVFQSHTQINRTVVVNEDSGNCCGGSKKSGFWGKLAGILTGGVLGIGLASMIGKLFGKKDKGTPEKEETENIAQNPSNQPQPTQENNPADKTFYGGQLPTVTIIGDKSKATKPLTSMDSNMKQDVAEEAKALTSMYGVIDDIKVDKQADGTFKVRIVVPDTLKYSGDTAALNGTCKNSQELNQLVDNALEQLLMPKDAKNNPFAKPQEE